jgi:hypothetical protein
MQIKSLCAQIVMCAVVSFSGAASANSSTSPYANLKLGNVCVAMARGRSYQISPTMDFYIVEVRTIDGKVVERIYIGFNPDVSDDNRSLLSRKLYKLPEVKRTVRLSGSQCDQILGIPRDEKGFYFHVMPIGPSQSGSNQASIAADSHGVSFC